MKKHSGSILVVDDDEHVLFTSRMILKEYFEKVETLTSPKTLESYLKNNTCDVVVLDMNFNAGTTSGNEGIFWMNRIQALAPTTQVVLQTAYGDIGLAVKSIKNGAVDFLAKPWDKEKLVTTVINAYTLCCTRRENRDLRNKQRALQSQLNVDHRPFIATSPAMQNVLRTIDQVAVTDANVLILGENGTGKELVARSIHNKSDRWTEPFITVDLGAVPAALFESEMFGHEKGAFTDAKESRMGKFELANNGTLFLDELGNLAPELQVKILSALQTRSVSPIGSNKTVDLNVRVICATNAPIHDLVRRGAIRQDLYYRINTVEIQLPPLRERRGDIPPLVSHYLDVFGRRYNKPVTIDPQALDSFLRYGWPGNIRELEHAVERAVILCTEPVLSAGDFQFNAASAPVADAMKTLNLAEMEKHVIARAVFHCGGNLTRAAEELGIGRTTLYRKIEEYGLSQ